MIIYTILVLSVAFIYALLLIFILKHWRTVLNPDLSHKENSPSLSIIIPVRNEAENIGMCLQSLLDNEDIDLINPQIIVVDDHSTDKTLSVVSAFDSKYILVLKLSDNIIENSTNAFKKAAVDYAQSKATGDYIIQLDGDVTVGTSYLKTILDVLSKSDFDFMAAPVVLESNDSALGRFQQLDMAGMMALTKCGIDTRHWYMANGANMIYKKDMLQFEPGDPASGDDVYGIQQVAARTYSKIHFLDLPDVFVFTKPMSTLRSFYDQRIRWATKNKFMKGWALGSVMVIPYLNSLLIMLSFFLSICVSTYFIPLLFFQVFVKLTIDYLYLSEISEKYGIRSAMKNFVTSEFIHILYLGIIGTLSFFVRKYNWKSRRVR